MVYYKHFLFTNLASYVLPCGTLLSNHLLQSLQNEPTDRLRAPLRKKERRAGLERFLYLVFPLRCSAVSR